ncbi:O-antigen ligase family protein [Providencia rettgeri]|nr:hypothetical protein [Providencia rettgeri]
MFAYLFYIYSILMSIKLGFFFEGASRYIPLRASIFLFIISLFLILFHKGWRFSKHFLIFSTIYFAISILFLIIWTIQDSGNDSITSKFILGFLFPYLIIFNLYVAYRLLNKNQLINSVKLYILSGTILILIDTIIRLLFPDYAFKGDLSEFNAELARDSFYIFKYGSIMYLDSNYVALQLLVNFVLIFLFFNKKTRKILLCITALLILFTFSRSAYIGLLFIFFIEFYQRKRSSYKLIIITLILITTLFSISLLFNYQIQSNDISFNSKLEILDSLKNIDSHPLLTTLFGIGFEIGGYLYSFRDGAYAHAFIPLVLGEVGILGLILYLLILLYLIKTSPTHFSAIILVMFICGMSLIDPWDSIYIYSLCFIFLFYKKSDKCIN